MQYTKVENFIHFIQPKKLKIEYLKNIIIFLYFKYYDPVGPAEQIIKLVSPNWNLIHREIKEVKCLLMRNKYPLQDFHRKY